MAKRMIFAAALLAGAAVLFFPRGGGWAQERRFEIVERLSFTVPAGARELRLWLPRPPDGAAQAVAVKGVAAPWPHSVTRDAELGNETLYFSARAPKPGPVKIEVRYEVLRRRQEPGMESSPPAERDLRARGLVVVDDEIRAIAAAAAAGRVGPVEKARGIYDYVLKHMAYDKTGEGWGRGDSKFACRTGRGNCTDFHSLFIALASAEGIPSRFKIGFSLPEESGETEGYHCWAEFHSGAGGWFPVDISEAWKRPDLAGRYFGRLDPDRVLVNTGREIQLSPAQKGAPLNFMVRPYAELDGRVFGGLRFARKYRRLIAGG